mmetsp:Transcript_23942/g.29119  ORF Transcript_23942/g.29119 Transcript_23942/m.29119 type:complete len:91 (+) Transcript_23942:196-468(+)
MLIPGYVREDILKQSGYSRSEIASAVKEVMQSKNKRGAAVKSVKCSCFDEKIEKAGRKIETNNSKWSWLITSFGATKRMPATQLNRGRSF